MMEKLFLGFIYDVLSKSYLVKIKLPKKETDIFVAIKESIIFLDNNNSFSLQPTDMLLSFIDYLELKVIIEIDKLPVSYFVLSPQEKKDVLKQTIVENGLIWDSLRNILSSCSFEELQAELSSLILRVYKDRSSLLVQSARECDHKLKTEIRKHHKNKSFVSFQIQQDLLGGMRVYSRSVLVDSSWLGKIASLRSV
jgi:hypothetical protein